MERGKPVRHRSIDFLQGKERTEAELSDTRRAVEKTNIGFQKEEKVETTVPVLSASERSEAALEHPLSEQMNKGDGKGTAKVIICFVYTFSNTR